MLDLLKPAKKEAKLSGVVDETCRRRRCHRFLSDSFPGSRLTPFPVGLLLMLVLCQIGLIVQVLWDISLESFKSKTTALGMSAAG